MTIKSFFGEYRFLSNFWPVDVTFDGEVYPTVEHAYQAAKTMSKAARRKICLLATPGEAKRYGKKVKLRSDWEDVKIPIMRSLVRQKFSRPDLAQLLLETGDSDIIEGNTWGDTFWGTVYGVGMNHLGKILMQIRDELRGISTKQWWE